MQNLDGLQGIVKVKGNVLIKSNPKMEDLYGLNHLFYIDGEMSISDDGIHTLYGLNDFTKIDGKLIINNNLYLKSLSNLSELKQIGDSLSIEGNPRLVSLRGLHNLREITNDHTQPSELNIMNNPKWLCFS